MRILDDGVTARTIAVGFVGAIVGPPSAARWRYRARRSCAGSPAGGWWSGRAAIRRAGARPAAADTDRRRVCLKFGASAAALVTDAAAAAATEETRLRAGFGLDLQRRVVLPRDADVARHAHDRGRTVAAALLTGGGISRGIPRSRPSSPAAGLRGTLAGRPWAASASASASPR